MSNSMTRLRRPRVLAGSTLGLAGAAAAAVLAVGGTGPSSASAVTRHSAMTHEVVTHEANGTVLVKLPDQQAIFEAYRGVPGTNESLSFHFANGPATSSAPVTCTSYHSALNPKPDVKVLLGTDGTLQAGGGNTGASGPYHLASCTRLIKGTGANTGDPN